MGRLPPVLRTVPGAAGDHVATRHPPVAAAARGSRRRAARPRRRAAAVRGRGSTSVFCRTSTCTPRRSAATPATRTTGRPPRAPRSARQRLIALIANLRRTVKRAALVAGRHRMVRLRRAHELRRARDRRQGAARRPVRARGAGQPRLGSRREHRPLQPDRGRRGQARPRLGHRPGRRRAELPRGPGRGSRATSCRSSSTSPTRAPGSAGRAQERRSLHRSGEPGRPAGARAGPPPRDLAQRPAADAVGPVRDPRAVGDRRVRAQGGPDGPPPAGDTRATSSRTTRSRGSGRPRPSASTIVNETHDRGEPARPVPAPPARDRRQATAGASAADPLAQARQPVGDVGQVVRQRSSAPRCRPGRAAARSRARSSG